MFATIRFIIMANLVVLAAEMCAAFNYPVYLILLAGQLVSTNWLRLTKRHTRYDRMCVRAVFLACICSTISYTYMPLLFALHCVVSTLMIPENKNARA